MPAPLTTCPPQPTPDRPPAHPTPETLAYSFTLPAASYSPAIIRAATRTILRAHGLEDVTDAAVQVVSELASCACRFTTTEVYVSLRYRDRALRVTLYDGHPDHSGRHATSVCEARRRAALRVLSAVVKACSGAWGFGGASEPAWGTRMWVVLPREGARAYLTEPRERPTGNPPV
ncbi:ATP-binding protein [Streptomyces sp. NPDC006012]|uniref:ATP-binding protein n=1 Tax=Streptomyces sp. NPDC006012 TaxID=3364739 RepID=UPI0036912170